MYQNKHPKMGISVGIYSLNRPEAGYVAGGCICIHICIYIYMCVYTSVCTREPLRQQHAYVYVCVTCVQIELFLYMCIHTYPYLLQHSWRSRVLIHKRCSSLLVLVEQAWARSVLSYAYGCLRAWSAPSVVCSENRITPVASHAVCKHEIPLASKLCSF